MDPRMYLPKDFKNHDLAEIFNFFEQHSFATVI
jgi:predicted FMN-binding regulatory protein PaiB